MDHTILDVNIIGVGACPTLEHIALPVRIRCKLFFEAPGMQEHILVLSGSVIHHVVLKTQNRGCRIIPQVQIQMHLILFRHQSNFQHDTAFGGLL